MVFMIIARNDPISSEGFDSNEDMQNIETK
jgi:hypothetical protein